MRGSPRHYLYSKLYCWVGLDRIIRFAEKHQLPGDREEWKTQRAAIREAILSKGFHSKRKAFVQFFEGDVLDASALPIPLTDFLPASDERVLSTRKAIEKQLSQDGLVYRYLQDDGLPGSDSTFTLCSFWLVMNLALAGEVSEAREHFGRICGFANDVGLLSEQIDPESGELLGNFPQGFTHLALIRAALHLQEAEKGGRDSENAGGQGGT